MGSAGYLHRPVLRLNRQVRGTDNDFLTFSSGAEGYLPGDRSKPHPKETWGDECVVTLLVSGDPNVVKNNHRLAVDDRMVLRWTTGRGLEPAAAIELNWATWDVRTLMGRTAWIRIVDNNSGPDGFICVDEIVQSDFPARDLLSDEDGPERRPALNRPQACGGGPS